MAAAVAIATALGLVADFQGAFGSSGTLQLALGLAVVLVGAAALVAGRWLKWIPHPRAGGAALLALGLVVTGTGMRQKHSEHQESKGPVESEEECLSAIPPTIKPADREIDQWYCVTEFAPFWTAGKPQMLDGNKPLLRARLDVLDPSTDREQLPYTDETLDDDAVGAKLTRLFTDFPRYSRRFSLVVGGVYRLDKLHEDRAWNDWVVQLGTVRDNAVLVYGRFSKPKKWTPPHQNDCAVALAEGVPIARGFTDRADSGGKYQVIYEVMSQFTCFPQIDERAVARLLKDHPELAPLVREGEDRQAW